MARLHRATGSRGPTQIDQHVGANIRTLRHSQGRSLTELAVSLGLSHQQLQKYETGASRISAGMLFDLSNVLAVPLGDLFAGLDTGHDIDPIHTARARCIHLVNRATSLGQLSLMSRLLRAIIMDDAATRT